MSERGVGGVDQEIVRTRYAYSSGSEPRYEFALWKIAAFLVISILGLWIADLTHKHFDGFASGVVDVLQPQTILMLVVMHIALSVVMIVKRPTNALECALLRFMLAKSIFWAWLYVLDPPRPPAQYLVLVLIVCGTTVDLFARMFSVYVWPVYAAGKTRRRKIVSLVGLVVILVCLIMAESLLSFSGL